MGTEAVPTPDDNAVDNVAEEKPESGAPDRVGNLVNSESIEAKQVAFLEEYKVSIVPQWW